jgi:hypothetical protein
MSSSAPKPIFECFEPIFEKYTKINTNGENIYHLLKATNIYPYNNLVYYTVVKNIAPYGCMFKDHKGRYYIDYLLPKKYIDICTNFQIKYNNTYNGGLLIDLIINDAYINVDANTKVLFCCAPKDDFYIRFTFNDNPFDVTFSYDAYMFCNEYIRSEIIGKNYRVSGIKYYLGIATPESIM